MNESSKCSVYAFGMPNMVLTSTVPPLLELLLEPAPPSMAPLLELPPLELLLLEPPLELLLLVSPPEPLLELLLLPPELLLELPLAEPLPELLELPPPPPPPASGITN